MVFGNVQKINTGHRCLFARECKLVKHNRSRKGKWRGRERVVPGDEERLIQAVVDIDNEIVIGDGVNIWAWELPIDEYPLEAKTDQIRSPSDGSLSSESILENEYKSKEKIPQTCWRTPRG